MQLAPVQQDPSLKRRVVWEELRAAAASGSTVQGRVLNQCPGGYAVGVSGFVALLPYAQATTDVSQRVGTLSAFYIADINDNAQRLVVRDASLGPPPARKRAAGPGKSL
jgi:ribosomal protein S1